MRNNAHKSAGSGRRYQRPTKEIEPPKLRLKWVVAVLLLLIVAALRFMPDSAFPQTLRATLQHSTDIPALYDDLKHVLSAHTTGTLLLRAPLQGELTSPFGERLHPVSGEKGLHTGMDWSVPEGTAVQAPMDGTVSETGENEAYGIYLLLTHKDGYTTFYGHLESIGKEQGAHVSAGEEIARSGNTGQSTGPHLHFELQKDGVPIDPSPFLIP